MAKVDKPDPRAPSAQDHDIGRRIRARRVEIGMAQEVLAKRIGVTFQQVQKYEKATNRVSARTLVDIADALEIDVRALLPKRDSRSGTAGGHVLDDEGVLEVAQLAAQLNREGRRLLANLARTLVGDDNMRLRRR